MTESNLIILIVGGLITLSQFMLGYILSGLNQTVRDLGREFHDFKTDTASRLARLEK